MSRSRTYIDAVNSGSGRVLVTRSGRAGGAPLVLVHGYLMAHEYWDGVRDALDSTHETITIDLPGHGGSDRPPARRYRYDTAAFAATLVEVLDALELPRAALLGHSLGGGVALHVAAQQPQRVERLLLVCPAIYRQPARPILHAALRSPLGARLFGHVLGGPLFAHLQRRDCFRDPRLVTPEYVERCLGHLRREGGAHAAHASLLALLALGDNTAEPGRVCAPTLIVWGDEDRTVALTHGKRLARAIAGAQLGVIPACGHVPHLERPVEFLRLVQPFLRARLTPVSVTPVPPRAQRTAPGRDNPSTRQVG